MESWTQDYVRSIFDYDATSGWLIWRHNPFKPANWNGRFPGNAAGSYNGTGYITVSVDGVKYHAHRIIFLWLHGYIPEMIDHKDDDGTNNRECNLRAATRAQNIFNGLCVDSKGVERHGNKYRARIGSRNNRITIGSFNTYEEAHEAYRKAGIEIYGEFAR